MNDKLLKINIIILFVFFILGNIRVNIASSLATFEDRYEVLQLLKITENDENLDKLMTRNDFAKCVVKASPSKDKVLDYVDIVTKNGYMYRSINGDFKGEDFIRYNDVSRACLALLGYTNDDFTGNQVIGRNAKFKELLLDENIDKEVNDYFTKRDALNAIYNTLRAEEHISVSNITETDNNIEADNSLDEEEINEKMKRSGNDEELTKESEIYTSISDLIGTTDNNGKNVVTNNSSSKINILSNISNKNFYGKKVFDKLILKLNNELNADAYIERELIGPYIIKPGMSFTSNFKITDNNVYINGLKVKKSDLEYDIGAFGFALIYYDNTNSVIYAYTYREDIEANVYLRKDYVNEIYYNASDMTKPYKLMIGNNKYYIDSEDMKVMFSPSGKYRVGDQILFIASKYLNNGYSIVDITYDEVNKRYHFFLESKGREIYYNSSDKKWYYDSIVEDDSEVGYKMVKREYTGSFVVPEYDEEHISGGIIYAMKY